MFGAHKTVSNGLVLQVYTYLEHWSLIISSVTSNELSEDLFGYFDQFIRCISNISPSYSVAALLGKAGTNVQFVTKLNVGPDTLELSSPCSEGTTQTVFFTELR